jgi:hypothetical protein
MNQTNVLSNLGTSKVFLCILTGKKNPQKIANFLGVQGPPITEQLRRLERANVIEMTGKVGRYRNYEIKWKEFLTFFIDTIFEQKAREKDQVDDRPEEIEQIRTLGKNRYFKTAIEEYLKATAEAKPSEWTFTIENSILTFEKTLVQASYFKKPRVFQDREKQEFYNSMKLWRGRTLNSHTWRDACFNSAIEELLKS